MAMTDKKRRFAAASRSGATNKEAAIAAGYSEKTAPQQGSRLTKDPDVIAEIARQESVNGEAGQMTPSDEPLIDEQKWSDPKDFLVFQMNDPRLDPKLQQDAAKALLQFFHKKKGEGGKKEEDAAKSKGAVKGKFGPRPVPRMVVNNR